MSGVALTAIFTVFTAGLALAATPVEKSGNCPTLEREQAPENWSTAFAGRTFPTAEFPKGTIQKNITPEQSINCIQVPEGLKAQLWASEKMQGSIAYLQYMTFDERGRVWAVEPKSYPNIIRSASGNINDNKFQGGEDRIVILEDTDGDKVMDKLKVFRTGLNMPQSIEVVNGGVVVAMTPYIVFFPNQNDTSGTPVILFSGAGSSGTSWDTHGGINSLFYGLDNWIYGHSGYNTGTVNGISMGAGRVWRFRHTALGHAKTEFQVWSSGASNSDGAGQMEDGQIFQSCATGRSHIYHAAVQGKDAVDIRTVNPAFNAQANPVQVFYPITGDRYLWEGSTGKNANGWFTSNTTAVSGLNFYTARLFPRKYWNTFVFQCEGASKLCNNDSVVATSGSSWRSYRLPGPEHSNIIASTDAWVAPIQAKVGPDGAVWVLDWNNYLFLHNPATPAGPGSAFTSKLRDKTTSRIYRIVPADGKLDAPLNLANASVDELIATLGNPNMLWRLHAQRLLLAKPYSETIGNSLKSILMSDHSVDEAGNSPKVLHALMTLDGMGRFDMTAETATWAPVLADLLKHPSAMVRRNALRVMPRTAASATAINDACLVNDPNGHVRLQAMLALGETSPKPTGLKPLKTSYKTVDNWANDAATAAGLATTDTPCSTTPYSPTPVSIDRSAERGSLPLAGLSFTMLNDGFRLLPHGSLQTGTLTVYSLSGRAAFTSVYDASAARWTRGEAHGLREPVYGYVFRALDGTHKEGRISVVPGR